MSEEFKWPSPYKGLSYYGPNDVPLFAGRDEAVRRCARQLGDRHTRVLILQGPTGCGKSSFLRAGLIPLLENQRGRYEFARSQGTSGALFVRSTDSPLKALAAELFKLASNAEIQTEDGAERPDFSAALLGYKDAKEFVEKAGNSGELLIQSFRTVASEWPRTLVLIIDQGEEVLTLKSERDPSGERERDRFFDFIYRFSRAELDLKLIIAIRTEYYGKFVARMGRSARDLNRVEVFYLNDLTETEVVEAIKRPTSKDEIAPYGRPFDHYSFLFEPGLPERIAHEVMFSQNIKGGILPVVQIVCENLYNSAKKKSSQTVFTIQSADYAALPRLEVQLEEYLKQKLTEFAGEKLRGTVMDDEVDRWKDVLSGLSTSQIDGTVVTQLKSDVELRKLATRHGCRLPFEGTMRYLSDPNVRILRGEEVINSVTNTPVWAYSLGHDAIGLVMERWKTVQQERRGQIARIRWTSLALGVASGALELWRGFTHGFRLDGFTNLLLVYTVVYGGIGMVPRVLETVGRPYLRFMRQYFLRSQSRQGTIGEQE
jgi:hypothetical protein